MSVELSAASFEECLNQTFRLIQGEESLEVELIQVTGIKSDTQRSDKTPFSVLFRGPKDMLFEQQIMQIRNDTLGEHHLFMVPVGPDPDHEDRGMLFEAVFT